MGIRENVLRLRDLTGATQDELAKIAGVSRAAVSIWEMGKSVPRMGAINRICKHYGIRPANIVEDGGMDNVVVGKNGKLISNRTPELSLGSLRDERFVPVTIYSRIAAGPPMDWDEVDDTFPVPSEMMDRHPNAFMFRVDGESMNRVLPDGCLALVDPDLAEPVIDGRAYAVCVNGYAGTIKRVHKLMNGFELVPDSLDPTYRSQVYDYGDPQTDRITVIGRVIWYAVPFDFEI